MAVAPTASVADVLRHARVLLVDGHKDTCDFLECVLRARGAAVVVAGTVQDAVGLLAYCDLHVVVCDVQMTEDSESVGRDARQRGLLAVALTGRWMPVEVEATRDAGFDLALCDPIDPNKLCQTIADALRHRHAA